MKNHKSALKELLKERIDLRTEWGKNALKTIDSYYRRNASSKLSLLKSLITYIGDKSLDEVLNVEPVDYQTNVEARCVCGKGLSKEMYRMRLKGHVTEESPAYQVVEKIRAKKPFRKRIEEFILGSECYNHLPELLYDFGFYNLKRTITERKKKNKETVEKIVNGLSSELKEILRKKGIDANQLVELSFLTKNLELEGLEQRLLYDLDPGKKNSFANWFREGIKQGTIEDKKIARIYNALENAPNLIEEKDLAALVAYQYEFRKYDSKAVLGNIRKDLLYLNSLNDDNEIIKKYEKPNLDKHYVRPATEFRKRDSLENVTIRKKLDEKYLSFVEALGIKKAFPDIEGIRMDVNREVADKYGVGRTWDYLLEKLSNKFFEVKAELAEEYKQFGEIVKEKVLKKDEYLLLKSFFKRANIDKNERESYLKFYSMPSFKEVAPKIVMIGRKVKLAENMENPGILKKDFYLREEAPASHLWIGKTLDDAFDAIKNSYYPSKLFLKFRNNLSQEIYDNGLIEKKDLCKLVRWYDLLKNTSEPANESVKKSSEFVKNLIDKGLAYPNFNLNEFLNSKYVLHRYNFFMYGIEGSIKYNLGKRAAKSEGNYKERVQKVREFAGKRILEIRDDYIGTSFTYIHPFKWKNKEFSLEYYTPWQIEDIEDKMLTHVALDSNDIKKIDSLIARKKVKFTEYYSDSARKWYNENKKGNLVMAKADYEKLNLA
jgi:hypothetical protein